MTQQRNCAELHFSAVFFIIETGLHFLQFMLDTQPTPWYHNSVASKLATIHGRMAQLVEHIVHIDGVTGSSPVATTSRALVNITFSRVFIFVFSPKFVDVNSVQSPFFEAFRVNSGITFTSKKPCNFFMHGRQW